MNLPVVLDIIIGLIFIYLTLSLLASEFQELIATVLQWRAEHLKKSIEVLIAGGSDTIQDAADFQRVRNLANLLYDNPVIRDLNQEAKGPVSELFREITHQCGALYRKITRTHNVFGSRSTGPSYIPSESFATSFLETLQLAPLIHEVSSARLDRFKDQQLADIKLIVASLNLDETTQPILDQEFLWLEKEFNKVVNDFKINPNLSLTNSLDRMVDKLDIYLQESQVYLPESELAGREFQRQLRFLKANLESPLERPVLLAELRPSLSNLLDAVRKTRKTQEIVDQILELKEDSPIYKEIKGSIDAMPESLRESLYVLARRAERDVAIIEQDVAQFQREVEVWFDRSMDRASGVYKRNARGIALLIGIAIAVVANADTLYIVGSLSTDSLMRATANRYAEAIVSRNTLPTPDNFGQLQAEINQAFSQLSLPIGWNAENLRKQDLDGREWPPFLKRILGWSLSGVAISMGAAFWFDLLSKILEVRNTGKKPNLPAPDLAERGGTSRSAEDY